MNTVKLLFTSAMLTLSCVTSAANNKNHITQYTPANQSVIQKINALPSGDILVLGNNKMASYFSSKPAQRTELAKRMISILKSVKASPSIIKFSESKLHRHPRLKKTAFNVPLTDSDGAVYKFSYKSDPNSNLYILNFKYTAPSKS